MKVFDGPKVFTQKFEVSLNDIGRVIVKRKEVHKDISQMICSDGISEDSIRKEVSYEVYREVDNETRHQAIEAVKQFIEGD